METRHMQQYTDQQLFEYLKTGNESALNTLYDRYVDILYYRAYAVLRTSEDAEEVVQDVFVKLWNYRETIEIHTSLKFYLFQMARNLAFDHIKAKSRELAVMQLNVDLDSPAANKVQGGACPEQELLFNEYYRHYLTAVETLPPGRKKVYQLCHIEGKTYEQAAAQLSISRNAVKDHIIHATRFIKKYTRLSEAVVGLLLSFIL